MTTDYIEELARDEALRERVRALWRSDEPKTRLERFAKHPLASVVIGFLLTGVFGFALTQFSASELREREERQAAWAQELAQIDKRLEAVQSYSRLMGERHMRTRLLFDAIRRNARPGEIAVARKNYDEVRVRWGSSIQAHLLTIRGVTNSFGSTPLERVAYIGPISLHSRIDNLLWATPREFGKARARMTSDLDSLIDQSDDCESSINNAVVALLHTRMQATKNTVDTERRKGLASRWLRDAFVAAETENTATETGFEEQIIKGVEEACQMPAATRYAPAAAGSSSAKAKSPISPMQEAP